MGIIYMGSGDLVLRNLIRRVEVLFLVEDGGTICHVWDDVLGTYP